MALAGTVLFFAMGFLFQGLPGLGFLIRRVTGRPPPWTGVGEWFAGAVGPGPTLVVERTFHVLGREVRAPRAESSASEEAAALLGLLLTAGLALLWLRRQGGPRLLPDRADVGRVLDLLAWLVPASVVVLVGLALGVARLDGGRAAAGLVQGLVAPGLVHPVGALAFALRLVVLSPIGEEIVWRGCVYPGLRSRLSVVPASALGALLFGLAHLLGGWLDPAPLALQYAFALLAQHLVERRPGSLGAPLLLHAIGNLGGLALFAGATLWPDPVLALVGVS